MKKIWVRYWKKSGANMYLSETWVLHEEDETDEDFLKDVVEDWSDHVGGGFGSGEWKYGFEVNCPPSNEWLDNKIKYLEASIKHINEEITELKKYKNKD